MKMNLIDLVKQILNTLASPFVSLYQYVMGSKDDSQLLMNQLPFADSDNIPYGKAAKETSNQNNDDMSIAEFFNKVDTS